MSTKRASDAPPGVWRRKLARWWGLGWLVVAQPLVPALRRWGFPRTRFVGVTGSVGKTTAKNLLVHLLRPHRKVVGNRGTINAGRSFVRTLLKGLPAAPEVVVQEIGASRPGSVATFTRQVRPHAAVVTVVLREHYRAFRTLEAIAKERGDLVAAIPDDGFVVLNRDDPHVWGMRERTGARVVSFGTGPGADLRWGSHGASWPDRFAGWFEVGGKRTEFRTRLVGEHWGVSVAAAVATALELGVPAESVARELATFEGPWGRMRPEVIRGVTFLDDAYKAGWDALPYALEVLKAARTSGRKFLVLGSISDHSGKNERKYRKIARDLAGTIDGMWVLRRYVDGEDTSVEDQHREYRNFHRIGDLLDDLYAELREGDLVLVKGASVDHFERVRLGYAESPVCRRMNCGINKSICDTCAYLRRP